MVGVRVKISGLAEVIDRLREFSGDLESKAAEIAKRLADIGYDVAYGVMEGHVYSGETIDSLDVIEEAPGRYILTATSGAILFFEFGAGARYGAGHPLAGQFGMGPGTYPGQKHAFNPSGWWFETNDPNLAVFTSASGKSYGHSYGNPPHMPFYQASAEMKDRILETAREVLMNDRL